MSHPCSSSPEHANCGIKIVWLRTLVLLGYTFTDVLELALSKEASSTGFGIKYSQVAVMDQFSTFIVFCAVILKWKAISHQFLFHLSSHWFEQQFCFQPVFPVTFQCIKTSLLWNLSVGFSFKMPTFVLYRIARSPVFLRLWFLRPLA